MKNKIPYGRQFIDSKDISSVSATLKKDVITTGTEVIKFEQKIKKYLGVKYTITCNSGTSGLYLAMMSIGIRKNDVVIMPCINFVASYNVANSLGAKVYLCDIDHRTGQATPEDIENCCKKFKLKKVKAIIVMYLGGYPQNVENFYKLKKKYKSFIIEDACHAFGSYYIHRGKKINVGSCKHADLSVFSFHPLKTITTGEGGAITTNSKKLSDKLYLLRSLGIKKKIKKHWDYDVIYKGFNFRLSDFQCSLGISQLKKIKSFLSYRKKIADIYDRNFKDLSKIEILEKKQKYISSNHLYIIRLKKSNLRKKNEFIKFMLKNNIILQYHYIPIYNFKIFKGKMINENSKKYYNEAISLPIYYNIPIKKVNYIIKKIKFFFNDK